MNLDEEDRVSRVVLDFGTVTTLKVLVIVIAVLTVVVAVGAIAHLCGAA